jgi:predicted glycoside hydrolase/deacetylase ChbG (UPF0249 family)
VRYLIFNADDFGYSPGTNRGIVECHAHGVLTSTSLMVHGASAAEAAGLATEHPELAVGLHFDVWGEDEREFDTDDVPAVRDEFLRQLDLFRELLDRDPTHVDSHRHVHREPHLFPVVLELVEPLGVPLRGDGQVRFVGGFYGQWEWQVTNLDYVGVPHLEEMLRTEVVDAWTEFSCHPGYVSAEFPSTYFYEREEEIRTLTHRRIREVLGEEGISLASYLDYPVGGQQAP